MTDEKLVEVVARALLAVDLNAPPGFSWRHYMTEARAAILAYEAAKGGVAPAGWVMVPREPTPEMMAAAWAAWHSRHGGKLGPGPAFVEAIRAAMLAAAPAAPSAVDLGKVEEALSNLIDRAHDFGTFSIDNDEVDPLNEWDDKVVPALVPARSVLSDIRKARE